MFIINTRIKRSANLIIKNYKFSSESISKLKKSALDTEKLFKNLKTQKIFLKLSIIAGNSKKLNPKVTTPKIEKIIKTGKNQVL